MPPILRRATAADLPAVTALLEVYFTEWDIWQRDTPESLLAQLSAPQLGLYLAEQDGQPLACVLGRPCPSVPNAAECKRLYVLPEARGLGLARLLMQHLEAEAHTAGFGWMYLDTKAEFTAAIELYRRLGYTPCPRYNDNPQATMFFRKQLS
jgi:GNAT superfamily N-acetyltransferase